MRSGRAAAIPRSGRALSRLSERNGRRSSRPRRGDPMSRAEWRPWRRLLGRSRTAKRLLPEDMAHQLRPRVETDSTRAKAVLIRDPRAMLVSLASVTRRERRGPGSAAVEISSGSRRRGSPPPSSTAGTRDRRSSSRLVRGAGGAVQGSMRLKPGTRSQHGVWAKHCRRGGGVRGSSIRTRATGASDWRTSCRMRDIYRRLHSIGDRIMKTSLDHLFVEERHDAAVR